MSRHAFLGNKIDGTIDGHRWIADIGVEPKLDNSISRLSQVLQAACYVVVAFLSGMRDNEVKHLRRGCVAVQRDENGRPYRWKVNSLAFMGETDPSRIPAPASSGRPPPEPSPCFEATHPASIPWLLAAVRVGPGAGSAGRNGKAALTLAGINRQLNRFVTWVNDYCDATGRSDGIALVGGRPWQSEHPPVP